MDGIVPLPLDHFFFCLATGGCLKNSVLVSLTNGNVKDYNYWFFRFNLLTILSVVADCSGREE